MERVVLRERERERERATYEIKHSGQTKEHIQLMADLTR